MTIFFPGLLVTGGGQVETSDELDTPILISLFSWARAEDGDVVDRSEVYGWWADQYNDVPGDRFGSRLWTLKRMPITKAVLAAPAIAEEALQWMVEDLLVKSVKCTAELDVNRRMTLVVMVEKFPINGRPIAPVQRVYTFPLV